MVNGNTSIPLVAMLLNGFQPTLRNNVLYNGRRSQKVNMPLGITPGNRMVSWEHKEGSYASLLICCCFDTEFVHICNCLSLIKSGYVQKNSYNEVVCITIGEQNI